MADSIADLMAQLQTLASDPSGTMPAPTTTAYVWMGSYASKTPIGGSHGAIYAPGNSGTYAPVAAETAVLQMQGWDQAQLTSFKNLLESNGFEPQSYSDLESAWSSAVSAAAQSWQAYQAGIIDKPLTPEEALRKMGRQQDAVFGGSGGGGPTTTSFSNTNTSVNELSQQEARGGAYNASQAFLGRAPRDREVAGFRSGYNDASADNPEVTSQSGSTTTDGDSSSTTSRTNTSGGIDDATFAREWAQSRPDYAEFQAATTYMDALVAALGRQVG